MGMVGRKALVMTPQDIDKDARIAQLEEALLALHGPPPGCLCTCLVCMEYRPCPGQALSASLSDWLREVRAKVADACVCAIRERNYHPNYGISAGYYGASVACEFVAKAIREGKAYPWTPSSSE